MIAKVFVLALVAVASCEDHGYSFKSLHMEPAQGYKHYYEHAPRVHEEPEPAHETRYSAPSESHGPAYSSQSIIHHAPHGGQESSQEARDEHVAPVYQYVQEEEEAQVPHIVPAKHYQSIQYPAPAHHDSAPHQHEHVAAPAPQPHVSIRVTKPHVAPHAHYAPAHYSHGHEEENYHHGAQIHEVPAHHAHRAEAQHHEAPTHHAYAEPQLQEVPVHHAHHVEAHGHDSHDEPIDYYAYPKYQYEYKVEDPHTGDNKFQHEYRDGDVVKGVYSLQEADGSIRTVEYSSDKHHGFSAVVKHSAPGQHVQVETHHQN